MIYGGLEIKLVNVRNLYGEASTQDTKLKRNKYTLLVSEFRPVEAESRSFEVESSPGCRLTISSPAECSECMALGVRGINFANFLADWKVGVPR